MERTRIQTYEQWLQQWNGPGQQSFELASSLLFVLPEVVAPLKREKDIFSGAEGRDLVALMYYFRALYHVMSVTLNEGEGDLVRLARRAVTLLLDRCGPIHNTELPQFMLGRSRYRDWNELPSRLLEYLAHTRSHHSSMEHERQITSQCVHTLVYQEGQRRKHGSVASIEPFLWPDFKTEPHKTQLLRAIIIHWDANFPWYESPWDELSDLLDDFFVLLCDARDYQYAHRAVGHYPRQARQEWPEMLDLFKLEPAVHKLGLVLNKPREEILSPLDLEAASKLGR